MLAQQSGRLKVLQHIYPSTHLPIYSDHLRVWVPDEILVMLSLVVTSVETPIFFKSLAAFAFVYGVSAFVSFFVTSKTY